MFKRNWILGLLAMLLSVTIIAKPTFAMERNIINEEKTVMPANERVDNIIVFGHDMDVKGRVDVSAIVVNGNLKISKTAKINGLVLVINGTVVQEPGSYVKENILAFKFKNDTANHLLIGTVLIFSSWLLRFVLSVVLVLLSVLISLLMSDKGAQGIRTMRQRTGKILLVGAVAWLVMAGICLLLIFTVFGIPFAIILMVLQLAAFLYGMALVSRYLGDKLVANGGTSIWLKSFAGSFLLTAVFNFPFFGWLAALSIFWLSTGFIMLLIMRKWRKVTKKE